MPVDLPYTLPKQSAAFPYLISSSAGAGLGAWLVFSEPFSPGSAALSDCRIFGPLCAVSCHPLGDKLRPLRTGQCSLGKELSASQMLQNGQVSGTTQNTTGSLPPSLADSCAHWLEMMFPHQKSPRSILIKVRPSSPLI